MTWDKEWTIESVENNYRVLGCIDPEDVQQLIADAKELRDIKEKQKHVRDLFHRVTKKHCFGRPFPQ